MRIARFRADGDTSARLGAVTDTPDATVVVSLDALGVGDDVVAAALLPAADREAALADAQQWALADVVLLAPVPRPGKFLAIGLNYRDHIEEGNRPVPENPVFFNKQITCVNDPNADIPIPAAAPDRVDYEGELGFVIGRRCRNVGRDEASTVVAGYLIVNDVSVRDWQKRSPTMTLGKSWDGHGPIGPWLVTADEFGDPHGKVMQTFVNGELRQDTVTDRMVFDCWDQIEVLSTVCTLEPGDVIASGTSGGVGLYMDPPSFMADGDVVRITVDGLGYLENTFRAEEP